MTDPDPPIADQLPIVFLPGDDLERTAMPELANAPSGAGL